LHRHRRDGRDGRHDCYDRSRGHHRHRSSGAETLVHSNTVRPQSLFAAALLAATCAQAHHSFSEYDAGQTIEIQGKLVNVAWQNPHVHLTLQTTDKDGHTTSWDLESNSLSILRRTNATPDNLKAGDTVKVAGWPSKRDSNRMFVTNVLAQNGQELVLDLRSKPRWASTATGLQTSWMDNGVAAGANATIFTVWSSNLAERPTELWKNPKDYPLTEKAKQALAKWDPVRDTVAKGCTPKGMPTIIEQPYPIEFVDKRDTILMRLEEYDSVRTIHMKRDTSGASQPRTRLGYSRGHWEGKTLVVATSRINWPHFDSNGVPQGPDATIVERFTPSADGSRLDYTMLAADLDTFTRPVELKRGWVRRPGEQVKPYNCAASSKSSLAY